MDSGDEYREQLASRFADMGFSAELVSKFLDVGMRVPEDLRPVYTTEAAIQRDFQPSPKDWEAVRAYRRGFSQD